MSQLKSVIKTILTLGVLLVLAPVNLASAEPAYASALNVTQTNSSGGISCYSAGETKDGEACYGEASSARRGADVRALARQAVDACYDNGCLRCQQTAACTVAE